MVNTCVVFGCHNRSDRGEVKRSYHSIPKVILSQGDQTREMSTNRRSLWIARIGRKDWTPTPHSKVCSDHFLAGKPSALYEQSHPDWAPSLKLKPDGEKTRDSEQKHAKSMKWYQRNQDRQKKKEEHSVSETLLDLRNLFNEKKLSLENHHVPFIVKGNLYPESSETLAECKKNKKLTENNTNMENMRTEFQRLTLENMELKAELLESKFTPEAFEGKDDKVRYLTGLPGFFILMNIFKLVEGHITESLRSSLTKFEKLILVLMRLRLNLSVQDLAYRFHVSKSTISRTFISVIHVLNERMKVFIYWPDREQLRLTMPMEFRKSFGLKVAIIIDCFEIFIERPSNLLARAETWSSYKHHNTVKFLIGVTPQGSVSFLSKAWGGRSSDKKITENCGLLTKLLPGDLVLADRGFDIAESVGLMCAEVKIPAFTRGRKQLSPLEVEATRKIAHVRIHVERVIGLVRNKYTILQDILPIDFLLSSDGQDPLVDEIVSVCCALTNMCESVVPFD